jgi:hypothetical protein
MTVLPLEKSSRKNNREKNSFNIESHPIEEGSIASLSLFNPKEKVFLNGDYPIKIQKTQYF